MTIRLPRCETMIAHPYISPDTPLVQREIFWQQLSSFLNDYRKKDYFIKMVANEYLDDFKQYTALTRIHYSGAGDVSAPNVTVMLVGDDGKVLKTTKTDSNGLVKFDEIPTDKNYRQRVSLLPGR